MISAVVIARGELDVRPLKTKVSSGNWSWLTLLSKLRIGEAPVVAMVAGSPNLTVEGMIVVGSNPDEPRTLTRIAVGVRRVDVVVLVRD